MCENLYVLSLAFMDTFGALVTGCDNKTHQPLSKQQHYGFSVDLQFSISLVQKNSDSAVQFLLPNQFHFLRLYFRKDVDK